MMQITEDTPPDMLAGAMDLTVHLPTGRTVKMSVERSTPMMDLLVQITTAHHLQHSGHILQALEMAPSSSGYTDKILPYKPNTPIGALDTQHVKVIPKNRSIPVSKNVSAGHQPFESTFRLQVHLPRNQLYVIRVSQYVYLGDIMKKVCEEKNLDSMKYEFRHPGNLDEVLDPKLTLSDYKITEVYIVSKGTVGLTQAFSSSDIMALRKEEERKQLQARTGGGVFSLIFKRGKTSMGSGSLSSENRSISPSHSDDSRSVTPPAIQQQILPPITQETHQASAEPKPKPPQRKRRPAPKPPQHASADNRKVSTDKPPSQISGISDTNTSDIQQKKIDNNGLTICHSRNSSDSSGYHEPSVLSDNCNTSLPRRPKSTIINEVVSEEVQSGENSRSSSGNLSKMSTFSKSTTSITSRKKKAAPPPPPVLKSEVPITIPEKASLVVASPPVKSEVTDQNQTNSQTPVVNESSAIPENKTTSSSIIVNQKLQTSSPKPPPRNKVASEHPKPTPRVKPVVVENPIPQARSSLSHTKEDRPLDKQDDDTTATNQEFTKINNSNNNNSNQAAAISSTSEALMEQLEMKMEENMLITSSVNSALIDVYKSSDTLVPDDNNDVDDITSEKSAVSCNSSDISESHRKPPEVIAVIPKKSESLTSLSSHNSSSFDTIGRKRGFNIGTSLLTMNENEENHSVSSHGSTQQENIDNVSISCNAIVDDYEINDLNIEMFNSSLSKGSKNTKKMLHELHGIHDLDSEHEMKKNRSVSSLRSSESMPSFLEQSNIKKWNNVQELDHISLGSDTPTSFGPSRWVVGDTSDTESITTPQTPQTKESRRTSPNSTPSRQESRNSIIPDGTTTTPPNESSHMENYCPKQKDTPCNESRNSIVLENKISSPTECVNSLECSSYASRNSTVLDNTNNSPGVPFHRKDSKNSINSNHIETIVEVQSTTSPKSDFPSDIPIPSNNENPKQDVPEEFADLETEWQYQLPSPPTAFRDLSPTNLTDVTNYDTITLQDFKEESVVTNPELFEKLKLVKESQCDAETISDFNSVMSDDDKPMFSKLTLENLEKRKSLVYNRELSTSLKIAQDNVSSSSSIVNNSNNNSRSIDETSSKRSSILSELEGVIQNGVSKSLVRHNSCVTEKDKTFKPTIDSNLPNFKISTYDKPKRKINIFEDDSVRSNDNSQKTNSYIDLSGNKDNNFNSNTDRSFFTAKNSYIGQSMENISFKKQNGEVHPDDDGFKKPQEFARYKSCARSNFFVKHQPEMQNSMTRSESFSMNYNMPVWKPQNPVQRSKSQVALNKYKDELDNRIENDECLSKSNSLFDVSGLQSLEVMRMIQTKLNTPSNSTEHLLEEESGDKQTITNSRKSSFNLEQHASTTATATVTTSAPTPKSEPESTTNNTKTYRYQGPPAINLSTWSERPKTKVSLKEDTDYKINNNKDCSDSVVRFSTSITNDGNSIEVKPYINGVIHQKNQVDTSNNNVSIKINGTESITTNQESGNVVIKIGESQQSKPIDNFSTRFINHSSAVGYRKPLGNVNKIEKNTIRPHSVAFDSDFDISRVPIVRSVELKKPFKDNTQINNTTITQINSLNNESTNKYADIYRSTESVNEINSLKPQTKNSSVYLSTESVNRPVVRVNSFAQNRPVPTVMGFRGSEIVNDNTARSRKSWNVPNSYSTLPLKPTLESSVKNSSFIPNSNVPFSHITLKRIDSNKTPSINSDNTSGNKIFGNVVLRNTSSQIKNNVNNRYSTGSQFGVIQDYESDKKYSNGINSGVMPPPPPLMPKVTSVTKKAVKIPEPSSMDSRNELLSSIRNFGGMKGLRHVKV